MTFHYYSFPFIIDMGPFGTMLFSSDMQDGHSSCFNFPVRGVWAYLLNPQRSYDFVWNKPSWIEHSLCFVGERVIFVIFEVVNMRPEASVNFHVANLAPLSTPSRASESAFENLPPAESIFKLTLDCWRPCGTDLGAQFLQRKINAPRRIFINNFKN